MTRKKDRRSIAPWLSMSKGSRWAAANSMARPAEREARRLRSWEVSGPIRYGRSEGEPRKKGGREKFSGGCLWVCGRSYGTPALPPCPAKKRNMGKCSASPTYPQAQQQQESFVCMIRLKSRCIPDIESSRGTAAGIGVHSPQALTPIPQHLHASCSRLCSSSASPIHLSFVDDL